jgi:hypothetical protein
MYILTQEGTDVVVFAIGNVRSAPKGPVTEAAALFWTSAV